VSRVCLVLCSTVQNDSQRVIQSGQFDILSSSFSCCSHIHFGEFVNSVLISYSAKLFTQFEGPLKVTTREVKTMHGHMLPPLLHVCMQRALCTVKFMKSFAAWQHRFDVSSDFCHILLPCPRYIFAQIVISFSVGGTHYR